MKVVFRVDASVWIGSGHVMRCLVLADELANHGHDITFACLPLESDMRAFIGERGFNVITLTAPEQVVKPAHDADYAAWLPKPIPDDAHDFIHHVHAADVVVTDHYAIEKQWHEIVRARLNCKIVAIDDLLRTHSADIVIDQTLGREASDYQTAGTTVLAGSDYALLSRAFLQQRENALSRTLTRHVPRVLVSMGGVDAPNATLNVLEALYPYVNATFTVLLSPRAPHYHEVKQWCSNHGNVNHVDFVADMASLMMSHDIAIGAPGTTSWERACLGLPSVLIPIAKNQADNCRALVDAGAVRKVEFNSIDTQLVGAYQEIKDKYSACCNSNLAICDGLGVNRVVDVINKLENYKLKLRYANKKDIELIYEWQSLPSTRKYFNNSKVPTYAEHSQWMNKVIESASIDLFVITKGDTNIGTIRVDKKNGKLEGDISILISPEFHSMGFAKLALFEIKKIFKSYQLNAYVHKDNISSQFLFERAGFKRLDVNNFKWCSK
ncbi:UDP-2,4-diacetamido-2,4,6-trideoxy-beta-L-altropyranose hydrolase [Salinivibrio sharmensis]|uniref:UDP-2,4-diacetamido-2,4, 6-trideoxy-beta-L-altropyranose hydrolase n=1 Tax=Salinivibrio sharmensis TaxID=390883 RepID=A0ABX3K8Z1_9GAMM|nr:UDP-2,4-diacetamido-2,4,6-trideoxy-beta-L-altropyranose hydrolase [Salinivibrio sharmensis]OOE85078.1 UDP-2,4-diacetamido-2,4,6-trideoxy-beta-L-altropyranose hydrolase [Salinivibrio sharmensis]